MRLGDEKRRVSELNNSMLQSRNDLARLQQENRDKQTELTGLQSRLSSVQTELDAIRAQGSPEALKMRVSELEAQLAEATTALNNAKAAAANAQVAANAPAAGEAAAQAEEKEAKLIIDGNYVVLYADRSDKMMVLNLGEENGLKADMVLSLVRNGKPYGDVVVKSVRDEMAVVSCDKAPLQSGEFFTISEAK